MVIIEKMDTSYKVITTSKGEEILISPEDFDIVKDYTWFVTNNRGKKGYAARSMWLKGRNRSQRVYLHRFILNAPKGKQVDHINGNKLDNRRHNLRLVDNSVNEQNKPAYGSSGLKGVSWSKFAGKWGVKITKDGKDYFLGYFECKYDAARMYNFWAIDLYGPDAMINKIINE